MHSAVCSENLLEYFESDRTAELQKVSHKLTIDSVRYLHVFFDVVIKFGQELPRVKPNGEGINEIGWIVELIKKDY